MSARFIPSPFSARAHRRSALAGLVCAVFLAMTARAAQDSASLAPPQPAGVQIVNDSGDAVLEVDGTPFFPHAAQFDYFRIPRDLWEVSLDRYRELGINTIDLRIPWNWHEPRDGEFDFDGHTQARRDLRGLLRLIAQKRFKLIARPGPFIDDQWRNAGYPDWLLERAERDMGRGAIDAGAALALVMQELRHPDGAIEREFAGAIPWARARQWLTAVGRELAPYGARRLVRVTDTNPRNGDPEEKEIPGPLLAVVLDNDQNAPRATAGEVKYWSKQRAAMSDAGLDALYLLTPEHLLTDGLPALGGASGQESPLLGMAGSWRHIPAHASEAADAPEKAGSLLDLTDAAALNFLTATLAEQASFPPLVADFSQTTFAPSDDVRAADPPMANMLLASRILLGSGLRGIEYSPLQDSMTPAGWGIPGANRYFRWDAGLDVMAERQPRERAVARNGSLIRHWGAMLAASHLRADLAIVDLRGAAGAPGPKQSVSQISGVAALAGLTAELVNPEAQPVERLLRDPVIFLPAVKSEGDAAMLSDKARDALVEFVRRGGVLAYGPERPAGAQFEPLWQAATNDAASEPGGETKTWTFGMGRVAAWTQDIFSGLSFGESSDQSRARPETSAAAKSLQLLFEEAGGLRSVHRAKSDVNSAQLVVSLVTANTQDHPGTLSAPPCVAGQLCAAGLLSVTNLNPDRQADETLEILDPSRTAAGASVNYLPLDVSVPPLESLLLPVHAPLCSAATVGAPCTDEIVTAGAEFLGAQRDGRVLELTFYAPSRATIRLRLERVPAKLELDNDLPIEGKWTVDSHVLEVQVLRGAAPDYLRVLKLHLRYEPHVVEKPDAPKQHRRDFRYSVIDAARLPLASDAALLSDPPLMEVDSGGDVQLILELQNRSDSGRSVDIQIEGPFHGSGFARLGSDETRFARIKLKALPDNKSAEGSPPDAIQRGLLEIGTGRDRSSTPLLFVLASGEAITHYQYDFDRDGAPEWVLESGKLRLILSPEDGGRALALVDKASHESLISEVGAFRDSLMPLGGSNSGPPGGEARTLDGAYSAEWLAEKSGTALRLAYHAPSSDLPGAAIEKTIRMTAPDSIEAKYRVTLEAAASDGGQPERAGEISVVPESLATAFSVPVVFGSVRGTTFCWQTGAAPSEAPTATSRGAAPATNSSSPQCESFVPDGKPLEAPAGTTRLEIRTPGRPTLAVEWDLARARIVPRNYSALVEIVFPALSRAGVPGEYSLRYTARPEP